MQVPVRGDVLLKPSCSERCFNAADTGVTYQSVMSRDWGGGGGGEGGMCYST